MRLFVRFLIVSIIVLPASLRAQYLGWDQQEQARTHTTDIQHIEMHISFDQASRKVMGTVLHTLTVLPQVNPVNSIVFDATELHIEKVWLVGAGGKTTSLSFDTTEASKLRMMLPAPAKFDQPMTIGIQYWGTPRKGMYFIEPDTFYTNRQRQIWTQGEGEDNHYWLPTYDYPNDKTTTDMFVTVAGDQQALSNGRLVSKDKNKNGGVTWHWKEEKAYSTYLIMLGVGKFDVVTEKWRGKDVDYWVYPGWGKEAHRIFGLTPKMLEFFSSKTGFPYAWEKYAQIAIADFMYGGMENVSATTLNDYVLYDPRAGIDFSSEGLIAHELAHQWFGDVVTCRSWIHMWLNESFATYFEALFREFNDGKDEFDEEMQNNQNAAIGAEFQLGKKPIVAANNYTANQYPRGSTVLNMLRHILGEEGFWKSINHYLTVHQFQPVVTEDLKIAIEEATGQNLQWFFDQWLYKDGHPMLDVTYNYDSPNHLVRMTVAQLQPRDSMTGVFKMPIDVELTMPDGTTRHETVRLSDTTNKYTFVADQKPAMVIFDKGNTTLKELFIHKPVDEWIYQLAHGTAIERSQAAQNMSPEMAGNSQAAFAALSASALHDPFWSVRNYALISLAKLSDSAHSVDKLLTQVAIKDPKSDVRGTAIDLLTKYGNVNNASSLLTSIIDKDSSYRVVGSALRALYKSNPAEATRRSMSYIRTSSPRDRMRQSAIDVLSMSKDEQSLDGLIGLINQHDVPKWTRWNIIKAIGSMVTVDSQKVYTTLWNLASNGDYAIRGTALNAIADIGDRATYEKLQAQAATRPDMKVTYDALLLRMRKRLGL